MVAKQAYRLDFTEVLPLYTGSLKQIWYDSQLIGSISQTIYSRSQYQSCEDPVAPEELISCLLYSLVKSPVWPCSR